MARSCVRDEHVPVNSLQIFLGGVLDRDLSTLTPKVDVHLCSEPLLKPLFKLDDRRRPNLLRTMTLRLTLRRAQPYRLLNPANCPSFSDSSLGYVHYVTFVVRAQERPSVAGGELSFDEHPLDNGGELEETHGIRDRRSALPYVTSYILMGHSIIFHKLAEGCCLFEDA